MNRGKEVNESMSAKSMAENDDDAMGKKAQTRNVERETQTREEQEKSDKVKESVR